MSNLDDLIAKLCPNGVEYTELGKLCAFRRGTSITQKDLTPGDIPVIAGGQKPAYYCNQVNRTGETITVSSSGAYAGYVSYWNRPIFVSDAFSVEPKGKLITKYLFYFLKNKQQQIYSRKTVGGIPHVYGKDLASFLIPVPPLPVQQEIARILDKFTELESELESELKVRKKQYEYYRRSLLTFDNDVEHLPFKDIVEKNIGGGTPSKAKPQYWGGDIPWASVKDVVSAGIFLNNTVDHITKEGLRNSSSNVVPKDWLIICTRINPGLCAIAGQDIAINQDLRGVCFSEIVEVKYIWHYFQTLNIVGKGTTVKGISIDELNRIIIPIPSLEEQRRIISILDRFDTLVNDITQGLPAEIEARRKQYEYYRDKLLTFKEAVS